MDIEKLAALEKKIKAKSADLELERRKNLINQARVDVFVKLLDKHKSLSIERFSRNSELQVLIADSKKITEELFKN